MNSENTPKEEKEKLNKIKSKDSFDNLASDYFMIKIFDFIEKKKRLKIMQHNKKLQKRINISIDDYKEYSQFYTPIEIELKASYNKNLFGNKFIKISEEERKYYHIYFNNSKEEIKRDYLNRDEKKMTIKIIIDYQVKSFKALFDYCRCISSINFKKFNRFNITDMSFMFSHCSSLKELNLTNFNTNNVTTMSWMFSNCESLEELNLSHFNTNKVTDMENMFYECKSLKKLNLSNFNTNNVTNMNCMFSYCSSLKKLNLSNFNTNKVTEMSWMFSDCKSLEELNITNFSIKNVTAKNMYKMFNEVPITLQRKIKKILKMI